MAEQINRVCTWYYGFYYNVNFIIQRAHDYKKCDMFSSIFFGSSNPIVLEIKYIYQHEVH
jgi:hypothetical protein